MNISINNNASVGTLVSKQYAKRSPMGEIWHRLKSNKGAVVGLAIIVILVLIAIYSSIFINYDEQVTAMNTANRLQGPSLEHIFGTDDMGRDLFWRTLYGTRYSLVIGVGAVFISLIVGLILGSIAGYFGGKTDDLIMRFSDVLASIPAILMGMVIVTVLGQSLFNLMLAVGVTAIPAFTRITRASVLTVRNQEFVEAATAIGMPNFKIIFTQVIPNGLSPIIVTVTARMGAAIIEAAALSFLGFGVPVPTPEWGALLSAGRNYIRMAPHLTYFPGLFIMISVLAFNILGDGLRDALDPKLKK
jgi:peptide/nickel transport system permease protein